MALPSGLDARIGYGEESTYGTRVVPTRFLELPEESLSFEPGRDESGGIRAGARVLRGDRWAAGRKVAGGSVSHEIANKGFGMLFKHMLGDVPTITTPSGGTLSRDQTFEGPGDPRTMSLTAQVGRPTSAGVVEPFDYVGTKIVGWELAQELDEFAMLNLDLDCRDEDDAQSLATPAFPAAQSLFGWSNLVLTINAVQFDVNTLSIKGENASKTDRYFAGSTSKKEPLVNAIAPLSVEVTGEFESMTQYDRLKSGAMVPVVAKWTGALIEGALSFHLEVTLQQCRLDGTTPQVGGVDILEQPLVFKVLDDGTNPPVKLVYRTTDVAI